MLKYRRTGFMKSTMQASTEQKMKFSIKDLFSKCAQNRRKLLVWSHLLKKSSMENFIKLHFCAVLSSTYSITDPLHESSYVKLL